MKKTAILIALILFILSSVFAENKKSRTFTNKDLKKYEKYDTPSDATEKTEKTNEELKRAREEEKARGEGLEEEMDRWRENWEEREQREKIDDFLTDCFKEANDRYKKRWNETCKALGFVDGCFLDADTGAAYDKTLQENRKECYKDHEIMIKRIEQWLKKKYPK